MYASSAPSFKLTFSSNSQTLRNGVIDLAGDQNVLYVNTVKYVVRLDFKDGKYVEYYQRGNSPESSLDGIISLRNDIIVLPCFDPQKKIFITFDKNMNFLEKQNFWESDSGQLDVDGGRNIKIIQPSFLNNNQFYVSDFMIGLFESDSKGVLTELILKNVGECNINMQVISDDQEMGALFWTCNSPSQVGTLNPKTLEVYNFMVTTKGSSSEFGYGTFFGIHFDKIFMPDSSHSKILRYDNTNNNKNLVEKNSIPLGTINKIYALNGIVKSNFATVFGDGKFCLLHEESKDKFVFKNCMDDPVNNNDFTSKSNPPVISIKRDFVIKMHEGVNWVYNITLPNQYFECEITPVGSKCLYCSSSTICTKCSSGYAIKSGKCYKTCATGQHSVSQDLCCKIGYVKGKTNNVCYIDCQGGKVNNTKTTCQCPDGKWNNSGTCKDCSSPCKHCSTSATTCTACNSNLVLESNTCKCSDGKWNDSGTCKDCSSPCKHCSTSATTCTACNSNLVLESNTCKCSDGKWNDSGTCKDCSSPCKHCSTSATTCTACDSNLQNIDDTCKCPIGEWNHTGTCEDCDKSCKSCSTSATTCTTCNSNFKVINNKCSCPSTSWLNLNTCVDCTEPCLTCDSSSSKCTSCIPLYNLNKTISTCTANVGKLFIEDKAYMPKRKQVFIKFDKKIKNKKFVKELTFKMQHLNGTDFKDYLITGVKLEKSSYKILIDLLISKNVENSTLIITHDPNMKSFAITNETIWYTNSTILVKHISYFSAPIVKMAISVTKSLGIGAVSLSLVGLALNPSFFASFSIFFALIETLDLLNVDMPQIATRLTSLIDSDIFDILPNPLTIPENKLQCETDYKFYEEEMSCSYWNNKGTWSIFFSLLCIAGLVGYLMKKLCNKSTKQENQRINENEQLEKKVISFQNFKEKIIEYFSIATFYAIIFEGSIEVVISTVLNIRSLSNPNPSAWLIFSLFLSLIYLAIVLSFYIYLVKKVLFEKKKKQFEFVDDELKTESFILGGTLLERIDQTPAIKNYYIIQMTKNIIYSFAISILMQAGEYQIFACFMIEAINLMIIWRFKPWEKMHQNILDIFVKLCFVLIIFILFVLKMMPEISEKEKCIYFGFPIIILLLLQISALVIIPTVYYGTLLCTTVYKKFNHNGLKNQIGSKTISASKSGAVLINPISFKKMISPPIFKKKMKMNTKIDLSNTQKNSDNQPSSRKNLLDIAREEKEKKMKIKKHD